MPRERALNRRSYLRDLSAGSTLIVGLSLAGCVGLGALGNDDDDVDGTLIEMTDDNRFEPDTVTIAVGETVVWRNTGYAPHTVTAYEDEIPPDATYFASGEFTSEAAARSGASTNDGMLSGGDEYEHSFSVPGTYAYYCIPHEQAGMSGVITVEAQSSSTQGGA